MYKILFVCLGNICRSPVAEGIMLHLNQKLQLGYEIDSAGTAGYHVGSPPDPRTIENALKHGSKVSLLLDLLQAGSAQDVPDPYYGSEPDFEEVFQLVYQACSLIK
jgi:protein-tyrosine-phosphatase